MQLGRFSRAAMLVCSLVVLLAPAARAAEPEVLAGGWIVIGGTDKRGRAPFNPDALTLRYRLDRGAAAPVAGEIVTGTNRMPKTWKPAKVEDGAVTERIAMAYRSYESDRDRIVLADLQGGSVLLVNGVPYVGDIYSGKYGAFPVALRKGVNDIYVRGSRGKFTLTFAEPDGPVVLTGSDTTQPDLRAGVLLSGIRFDASELAVVVVNCTDDWVTITERASGGGDSSFESTAATKPYRLAPLGTLKVPIPLHHAGEAPSEAGELVLPVRVTSKPDGGGAPHVAELDVTMHVRPADEAWRQTFRSEMDDSVQVYAVRDSSDANVEQVVLSVHGASVRCLGQARSYSPRPGVLVAAATNRRRFGFDWQDWGRTDGYEVLADVLERTDAPRDRVCLTGHSMGGHGTWHFAANDPDGFAAIAPSAGWSQFDNYGGRPDQALEQPWYGADAASDTMSLIDNLVQVPTFVLHGTEDDNVPLSEAERMLKALNEAGGEPQHHFEEGKKHWWNGDAAPGTDCVDWPEIFALFAKSRIADAPLRIKWTTVDPVVDSEHYWVRVDQPLRYGERITIEGGWNPGTHAVDLKTTNARLLRVTFPDEGGLRSVRLDGQSVALDGEPVAQWFRNGDDGWTAVDGGAPGEKSAWNSGPFKRAIGNRFVMIVGTAGTDAENRELLDRARYESAMWRYRGNGLAEVITDVDFAFGADVEFAGRNVILFGNADTNAAWDLVFDEDSPIRARRGSMTIGRQTWERDDLAAIFVHRRLGDPHALAAAFADSGERGTRLHQALLVFVSGVGYPDYAIFSPRALTDAKTGVLAAGWFDHEWKLQKSE